MVNLTTTEWPGLIECFRDMHSGFSAYLSMATYSDGESFTGTFSMALLLRDFVDDLRQYLRVSAAEVLLSVLLALFLTLLRHLLTVLLFKPLAVHMKLREENTLKFPESSWKCFYYVLICAYLLRVVVFSRHNHIFYQPYEIWKDYFTLKEVPTEMGMAFLLEFSYYLHSLYGTLCIDLWRKDSPVMLFHHLLCLLLIGFSYCVRYHKVGLLLMFVHDFADFFLEFSKCQVYMKYRNGRYIVWHDVVATISFGIFALTWLVGRLYYFPIIVMRSSSHSTIFNGPGRLLPFYFVFNVLLSFMLLLNVYWFILIMKFFYKVLSGQLKDLDDIRDYEVEKKMKEGYAAAGADDDRDDNHDDDPANGDSNSSLNEGDGGRSSVANIETRNSHKRVGATNKVLKSGGGDYVAGSADSDGDGADKDGDGADKNGDGADKDSDGADNDGDGADNDGRTTKKSSKDIRKRILKQ